MIPAALDPLLRRAGARTFVARVNDEWLKLPRELRGLAGVDRASREGVYFERPAMLGLRAAVRPGDIVLDIGCSYGVLTCLICRLGASVHAVEPNAEVFYWARRVVELNGYAGSVRLTHACAGESSHGHARFFNVPGAKSVASTRNADIVHFHADAVASEVPLVAIDDYCEENGIRPACIKIDVEGGECRVLEGSRHTLESAHPHLVIETHGLEIDGIGGSAGVLVEMLASAGYLLFDLERGTFTAPAIYARRYANRIGYLLATVDLELLCGFRI